MVRTKTKVVRSKTKVVRTKIKVIRKSKISNLKRTVTTIRIIEIKIIK